MHEASMKGTNDSACKKLARWDNGILGLLGSLYVQSVQFTTVPILVLLASYTRNNKHSPRSATPRPRVALHAGEAWTLTRPGTATCVGGFLAHVSTPASICQIHAVESVWWS